MDKTTQLLKELLRISILNFAEIQHLKRQMNVTEGGIYDYPNALPDYIRGLDDKVRHLIKEYPHLSD